MLFYQTRLSAEQIAIWKWLNQPNIFDMMPPITSKNIIDKLSTSLETIVIYFMDYKFDTTQTTTLLGQYTTSTDIIEAIIGYIQQENITTSQELYTQEQLTLLTKLFFYGLSKAQDALQAPEKAYHWYKCLAAFATIAAIVENRRFQPNSSAAEVLFDVLGDTILAEIQNNHFSATWQNDHFFCHARFPFLNNKVSSKLERLLQRAVELFSVAA